MKPYDELLSQQRHLTPPPDMMDRLERRVMARLDDRPAVRHRTGLMAAGVAACGALALLALLVLPRERIPRAASPDFTESVILLDDHTCIWLEPAATQPGSHRAHE